MKKQILTTMILGSMILMGCGGSEVATSEGASSDGSKPSTNGDQTNPPKENPIERVTEATIGGTIQYVGLNSVMIVLSDDSGQNEGTGPNQGNFQFQAKVKSGHKYTVTASVNDGTCTVKNATGTVKVDQTAINDVEVSCASNGFSILGQLSTSSPTEYANVTLKAAGSVYINTLNPGYFTFGPVKWGTGSIFQISASTRRGACEVQNGSMTYNGGAQLEKVVINCK